MDSDCTQKMRTVGFANFHPSLGDKWVAPQGGFRKMIQEANRTGDNVSEAVVIDTLGMSDDQFEALRRQVEAGATTDNPIIFLR